MTRCISGTGDTEQGIEGAAAAGIARQGTLYRPPSEAASLVLQATIGCSYNECTFCGMYRDKQFRVRRFADLRAEIEWAAGHVPGVTKVFLADGDALMAPPRYLLDVLGALRDAFPGLRRVACYASPQALAVRSAGQMSVLRDAGLTRYYLGVESGDDEVLAFLRKGVDAAEMTRLGRKARAAGIELSTMILLGAGGRRLSRRHARASARVISSIGPQWLSTLVMTPVPGTPLWDLDRAGVVDRLDAVEITRELREFVAHLDLQGTEFRANHASNHLPLRGTLPTDRARLLARLDAALADPSHAGFVPEHERAL